MATDFRVSVSDFPFYDGSTRPSDFMRQCRRLAKLGRVLDDKLCEIVAARCKGLALAVVNAIEDFNAPLSLEKIQEALTARFESGATTAQQAAEALSSLVKGSDTAADYSLKVQQLVRKACPEFFNDDGQVKKICAPAHGAALYRHFLIGISDEEKRLLSRLKASTFEACVSELTREEALPADRATETVTFSARQVRWSSQEREPAGDRSGGGCCPHVRYEDDEWGRRHPRGDEASTFRSSSFGEDGRPSSARGTRPSSLERDGSASPRSRYRYSSHPARRSSSPRFSRAASPSSTAARPGRRGPPSSGGAGRSYWRGGGRSTDRSAAAGPGGGRPGSRERRLADSAERRPSGADRRAEDGTTDRLDGTTSAAETRRGNVRCWSCSGFGHIKRECPNEWRDRYIE